MVGGFALNDAVTGVIAGRERVVAEFTAKRMADLLLNGLRARPEPKGE